MNTPIPLNEMVIYTFLNLKWSFLFFRNVFIYLFLLVHVIVVNNGTLNFSVTTYRTVSYHKMNLECLISCIKKKSRNTKYTSYLKTEYGFKRHGNKMKPCTTRYSCNQLLYDDVKWKFIWYLICKANIFKNSSMPVYPGLFMYPIRYTGSYFHYSSH